MDVEEAEDNAIKLIKSRPFTSSQVQVNQDVHKNTGLAQDNSHYTSVDTGVRLFKNTLNLRDNKIKKVIQKVSSNIDFPNDFGNIRRNKFQAARDHIKSHRVYKKGEEYSPETVTSAGTVFNAFINQNDRNVSPHAAAVNRGVGKIFHPRASKGKYTKKTVENAKLLMDLGETAKGTFDDDEGKAQLHGLNQILKKPLGKASAVQEPKEFARMVRAYKKDQKSGR